LTHPPVRTRRFLGKDGVKYIEQITELVRRYPKGYRNWYGPTRPVIHLVRGEDVKKARATSVSGVGRSVGGCTRAR
jgi:hypothetical protein